MTGSDLSPARDGDAAAQLAAELDAFSYAVSHDLRAPLRSIEGFSRILVEDYAAALPEDAQDYLDVPDRNGVPLTV